MTETDPSSGTTISAARCAPARICTVTTPGNGPGYAVHLSVIATNAHRKFRPDGRSDDHLVGHHPGRADQPRTSTPLDHGLDITWSAPPSNGGSAITELRDQRRRHLPGHGERLGTFEVQVVDAGGIANGSAVNYSVSAHNCAFAPLANWNSASGTGFPAGPPLYESANPPTAATVGDDGTSAIAVLGGCVQRQRRRASPTTARPPSPPGTARHLLGVRWTGCGHLDLARPSRASRRTSRTTSSSSPSTRRAAAPATSSRSRRTRSPAPSRRSHAPGPVAERHATCGTSSWTA